MLRWKFAGIRIVLDCLVAFIIYKIYFIGADLGVKLTGYDFWCIRILFGAYTAAVIYWLFGKAKDSIFFLFKSGTIWSLVSKEDIPVVEALEYVTCDWKETFSIPAINYAVRGVFKQIEGKIGGETPEVLKPLESSSIYQTSKKLSKQTFSYADECTLAWCYKNDDTLLSECIAGMCLFVKHSAELMIYITPVILLRAFVRVVVAGLVTAFYVWHVQWTIVNFIALFILLKAVDYVLDDAILEPFMMDGVVRKYLACAEKDSDVSQVQSSLESILDLSDLKAKLRRFTDNGEDETDAGAVEDTDKSGVE